MTGQLIDTPDLHDLGTQLDGSVHLPGEQRYTELATPWNVAVANGPVAVVEARSADDVAATMTFAARYDLQVSVQATGHGAVEYRRPVVQISTASLRDLTVTPTGAVRAGAGVMWADVIDAGAALGFAALAGSAPGVGVVGFLTGGGIGPVARTYGVSADYVTSFDVVTGDGQIRRATATENPDLFWGLRGGKGTLGVVTAVEFDLVPLAQLLGGCLFFDGEDAPAVLRTWRQWSAGLPEQCTTSVAILRMPPMPGVPEPLAGKVTVAVRFAWVGDEEQGRVALAGIESAGRVVFGGVGVMPYAAIGMIHSDPVDPMPVVESSTLLDTLPIEAIETLVQLAGPQADCPQIIVEVRQLGGAISRAQGGASAYDFRDAAYAVLTIGLGVPPVVDAATAHSSALLSALAPFGRGRCLPNFQSSSDPDVLRRKYAPETITRLAALAERYDPARVVAFADAVRSVSSTS